MAQFDVHQNIARNRRTVPYLVVVQSQRWSGYPTRLVIPLMRDEIAASRGSDLAPVFAVDGHDCVANPLQMFYIPVQALGPVVASLADDANAARIIAALDEAIARGYR